MKPGAMWPLIITAALAIHAVAWLGVAWLATSNPSYAVEEKYYDKALAWDQKRAQDVVNAKLGWSLQPRLQPPRTRGMDPELEVVLRDDGGVPINDAAISLEAFHNARAGDITRVNFTARGNGVYVATVPVHRSGRWELRFAVDRAEDHFTAVMTEHLEGTR